MHAHILGIGIKGRFDYTTCHTLQVEEEVIDLCSSNSDSDSDCLQFSPIKANPIQILKRVIPNVRNVDYLDWQSKTLPIIARPLQGLSVLQLFTLMVGTVRICLRKPTSVTCNSVFVIDLS